ncbi:MAG: MFS transporter, partial [Pseudomonadota bacterium]
MGNAIEAFLATLKFREFRLFWLASTISLLGDQLTFIALPWLVLKLTGDPLIMGTVVAIAAIPRAVFMLLGGAVTDAYSPRVVMLVSNA